MNWLKKSNYAFLLSILILGGFGCESNSESGNEDILDLVDVFLGTSGDHGQMSPAASYPFSLMSIAPKTYPYTHTGYEKYAKTVEGFTHNRIEGVGCKGAGSNLLLKPYLGSQAEKDTLTKIAESASPGYYSIAFSNGISNRITVNENEGLHHISFPQGVEKGLYIDLTHTIANRFLDAQYEFKDGAVLGWVHGKTTCHRGAYKLYFAVKSEEVSNWEFIDEYHFKASFSKDLKEMGLRVAWSSVSSEEALLNITEGSFDQLKNKTEEEWRSRLSSISVEGDRQDKRMFFSLLYRTFQAPFKVSEEGGLTRNNQGEEVRLEHDNYNGWAVWDNYRTQLPLLSILAPTNYQHIVSSLAWLYKFGKVSWATQNESSLTVRTEHTGVVLLDAARKGYELDINEILDSMRLESVNLPFNSPDQKLETCYDYWALSELLCMTDNLEEANFYREKARSYRKVWKDEFEDIRRNDVDRMQARGLYQGTIWQYRWFVPFDLNGLKEMIGGDDKLVEQLDTFFESHYYNHANQPDLQVPFIYQATGAPFKGQRLVRHLLQDTVIHHYTTGNERGTGSTVMPIYRLQPQAYLPSMDDDAGTMSSWYVFGASGFFPVNVGSPYYYLHLPMFKKVRIKVEGNEFFELSVKNFDTERRYIASATLNGKKLERNWISHKEIMEGGKLEFVASKKPTEWGKEGLWVSDLDKVLQ
ncbi:glycoside hydrolase domain-containing protein [Echinicola sp. 20G]|uniref:glycoside hydrolase domain-containing protein n=1 Tax=Echinicola sp. 20G TaxID=2781961 RepID=UPI0019109D70|nr:glycoside hydrolase domain-containing protein [Echinicola sp. 20G]